MLLIGVRETLSVKKELGLHELLKSLTLKGKSTRAGIKGTRFQRRILLLF